MTNLLSLSWLLQPAGKQTASSQKPLAYAATEVPWGTLRSGQLPGSDGELDEQLALLLYSTATPSNPPSYRVTRTAHESRGEDVGLAASLVRR